MNISPCRKLTVVCLVPAFVAGSWILMLGGCAHRPSADVTYEPVPQPFHSAVVYDDLSPEYYIWDGSEYIGYIDDSCYYQGPDGRWTRCEPWREQRFRNWEHANPDWRKHARHKGPKDKDVHTPPPYTPRPLRTTKPSTLPPPPVTPVLPKPQPRPVTQQPQPQPKLPHETPPKTEIRHTAPDTSPHFHVQPGQAKVPPKTAQPQKGKTTSSSKVEEHKEKESFHYKEEDSKNDKNK